VRFELIADAVERRASISRAHDALRLTSGDVLAVAAHWLRVNAPAARSTAR
jgi:hypothetical protein